MARSVPARKSHRCPSGQKRLIDPLDEDTAILHRFDAVRHLYDFASGGIVGGIVGGERVTINELLAAARSFLSAPRITILSVSSGRGRCSRWLASPSHATGQRNTVRGPSADFRQTAFSRPSDLPRMIFHGFPSLHNLPWHPR